MPTLVIWLERLNSTSQWLDQWHFCLLMQLWSPTCLNSRQVQGTLMLLLQLEICVTRWHHIMHTPVLQLTKNPGSPSGPPRWYHGWSAIIKTVYFDNQIFGHGIWQENFWIRQSDLQLGIFGSPDRFMGRIWRPGDHLAAALMHSRRHVIAIGGLNTSWSNDIHNWAILTSLLICGFSQWALSIHVGLICQCLPRRFLADDTRFESTANFLTHDRPRTDDVFQHF